MESTETSASKAPTTSKPIIKGASKSMDDEASSPKASTPKSKVTQEYIVSNAKSLASKSSTWVSGLGTYSIGSLIICGGIGLGIGPSRLIPGLMVGYGIGYILDRITLKKKS